MGQIAKRVEDKRLLKLIRAFLNAGVMENGLVSPSVEGTPQGGPLSPLLSNLVMGRAFGRSVTVWACSTIGVCLCATQTALVADHPGWRFVPLIAGSVTFAAASDKGPRRSWRRADAAAIDND